jgi:hypothetical protein
MISGKQCSSQTTRGSSMWLEAMSTCRAPAKSNGAATED